MTRSQTLARTLSAALAISAIAVPAAGARPIDVGPLHHKDATSPVSVNARGTDVGAPDQQAAAITPQQDLRSPDARDAGVRPHGPRPILSVPVQANDRDGTPWSTIGLALVGCLALAGTAATAGRIRRRNGRAGITA